MSPAGHELLLLLSAEFPYAPPRVAWPDKSKVLKWPHVESDGVLCCLPVTTTVDATRPEDVIIETINSADELISNCISGANLDDFRKEFLSYWSIAAGSGTAVTSLCDPIGPTRKVCVWQRTRSKATQTVFGDTEVQLRTWLRQTGYIGSADEPAFSAAIFVSIEAPPLPDAYPCSAKDLWSMVDADERALLEDILVDNRQRALHVLIATRRDGASALVGLRLVKLPSSVTARIFNTQGVSEVDQIAALAGPDRDAIPLIVTRRDPSWVHGRDADTSLPRLTNASVAVVGCGSLGSLVAQHLVDSGVGMLHLVDGEKLDAPNTSRHALGAHYHADNKAEALAHALRRRHPHIRKVTTHPHSVTLDRSDTLQTLFKSDLVVCCTGEWASMAMLDDLRREIFPRIPLVTAWFEPHAIACISVLSHSDGSNLRDGFTNDGDQWSAVTEWNDADIWRQAAACAVTFAPYGAIELAAHASHVADHALSVLKGNPSSVAHVSLMSKAKLLIDGGSWTDAWLGANGGEESGARCLMLHWPFYANKDDHLP